MIDTKLKHRSVLVIHKNLGVHANVLFIELVI